MDVHGKRRTGQLQLKFKCDIATSLNYATNAVCYKVVNDVMLYLS